MTLTLKETLLQMAAEYCARRGISKATLALTVVNDGKFFHRIEAGGQFTATTYEKFMTFFRHNGG